MMTLAIIAGVCTVLWSLLAMGASAASPAPSMNPIDWGGPIFGASVTVALLLGWWLG